MENTFDVIIVGAGPGGATTAAYLGREGKKVLLIDKAKFPRDKTCGDAVSGKCMKVIRELGLVENIEKLPHAEIKGVTLSSPSGAVANVDFPENDPNRKGGTGYCVRRIYTDNMLFRCAKETANVEVKENFFVSEVIIDGGKAAGVRGIDFEDGRKQKEFRGKIIVGADGVNSMVARSVLGEDAKLDDRHTCDAIRVYYKGITEMTKNIEIHFFDSCLPGYFWIFPLENGYANVGLGLISKDLKKRIAEGTNLVKMFNDAIKNEPLIKERFKNAKPAGKVTGWRLPFGSYKRKLAGEGWVLVGDAASLVDPFSGEGVGNATAAGRLAAKTISKAIDEGELGEERLKEYEKNVWEELGEELSTSYKMQWMGTHFRWLLNKLVEKAATSKDIKELLSASLANEEAKKEFENPFFYLKILLT
ncbi:MAG: geranylgeranyl reductase family protein [Candidatus Micrarchaeota archaeon]